MSTEDLVLRITTAYEQGFGHATRAELSNPYSDGSLEHEAWEHGREIGKQRTAWPRPFDDAAGQRLRSICNRLGLATSVPHDNATLMLAQFTVLGMVRRAIDERLAAQPASTGAAVLDPNSDDAAGLAAPYGYWRGHNHAIKMMSGVLDAMQARIDELEQDATRLAFLARSGDFSAYTVPSVPHDFELHLVDRGDKKYYGQDLRECIDAALASKGDKS